MFGEEHGREAGREPWTWVIDPIDGTSSFILGQLHWGVLIALNDGTRPVLGVAYQPFVGEAFVGRAGGPSEWRRGDERRPLSTRRCARHRRCGRRHHRPALLRDAARGRRVRRGHRRRALHALRRRLLLLHAAGDGPRRHRHRNRVASLRHPGADPADRERGRRGDRLGGRRLPRTAATCSRAAIRRCTPSCCGASPRAAEARPTCDCWFSAARVSSAVTRRRRTRARRRGDDVHARPARRSRAAIACGARRRPRPAHRAGARRARRVARGTRSIDTLGLRAAHRRRVRARCSQPRVAPLRVRVVDVGVREDRAARPGRVARRWRRSTIRRPSTCCRTTAH